MSTVLDSLYANYLTLYEPKSVTKYDTHKKSELRDVYDSIVKINKDAPWYLPTKNGEDVSYAINLKENARQLHNTIAQLGGLEDGGLMSRKNASSSNTDLVNASYIGPQDIAGDNPGFTIEVKSLATPQENMGAFLKEGATDLEPDTYSFDVSVNDMKYEFQFAVDAGESNRDIQSRLVKLLNNSSIGIKATLIESESDMSSIRLTSEGTGSSPDKPHIFEVSDDNTSKRKGAVEYFGLDYVSHEPTNAEFAINGEDRSAYSNHFTVGKMFEIELKGTGAEGETVEIGIKKDVDTLKDNMRELVGNYNAFIKAASEFNDSRYGSKKLVNELKGMAGVYSDKMVSNGLSITNDGSIDIDMDKLEESALSSDDVKETFSFMKDFTANLLRKSDQVALDPMNYVDKTVVAYKNPGHNFNSPYTTSNYSGMMFNFYC